MNKPVINVVDIITTDEDKKFEPVGHMANAIIAIHQEQGGCLPQDLNAKGFSPQQVADFWHMANALASVELHAAHHKSPARPKSISGR